MNKKLIAVFVCMLLLVTSVAAYIRWQPVPLCYKSAETDWQCLRENGVPAGQLLYRVNKAGKLQLHVDAQNLDPEYQYQLTLNGQGETFADGVFATMGDNGYESGMWGTEGFWNFETNEDKLRTYRTIAKNELGVWEKVILGKAKGWNYILDDLPVGCYEDVKFIVKQVGGVDETHPYGTSWEGVLMETKPLNFCIE